MKILENENKKVNQELKMADKNKKKEQKKLWYIFIKRKKKIIFLGNF